MNVGHKKQTILCIDFFKNNVFHRSRIEGICRFARLRGWRTRFFSPQELPSAAIGPLLARICPVGCLVECSRPLVAPHYEPPLPDVFGDTPVVYIDPQDDHPGLRGAAAVFCDEAAVARMAFRELSSGNPPSYAAVPFVKPCKWSDERVAAFRALCAERGTECHVFPYCADEDADERDGRLSDWCAALPQHCAVFAVNDLTAWKVADAFHAAGRHVPRSATIVGVDGYELEPDSTPSRISSIKLDIERSGFIAARLLGEMAEDLEYRGPALFGPLLCVRRGSTRGRGRHDPRILEATEAIRRTATDGLSVSALASRFGSSRRLFEIRFREAMGHSAIDEILHVRLEYAQALLSRGDMSVAAVADFCGFGTVRQMHRVFRSRTGMSPREWRKVNCL